MKAMVHRSPDSFFSLLLGGMRETSIRVARLTIRNLRFTTALTFTKRAIATPSNRDCMLVGAFEWLVKDIDDITRRVKRETLAVECADDKPRVGTIWPCPPKLKMLSINRPSLTTLISKEH